ncbi:MAG: DUF362 domain-containing protein [Nanoarchaeota archaeon]|nr:DUF362 domain-containing protein [Nanoarchaeota archaeon]
MVKGAAIKFTTYPESVNKLLNLLKVTGELKKYDKIVLKPFIKDLESHTPVAFVEAVLQYCLANKNPVTEVFIAEGVDGSDTTDLFDSLGYKALSEKYSIGLIDLNNTEVEETINGEFLKFQSIKYPKILLEACVISLPILKDDEETEIVDSLSNMLGAYPSKYYAGFFSLKKNKIRKWPIKFSIHDILKCKMPNFAVIDASQQGQILAGLPLEIDKQAAKTLGKEWKSISHLRLIDDSFSTKLLQHRKREEESIQSA